jgi:bacterial leucyl aminopeptidase
MPHFQLKRQMFFAAEFLIALLGIVSAFPVSLNNDQLNFRHKLRLLEVDAPGNYILANPKKLIAKGKKFMDVTDNPFLGDFAYSTAARTSQYEIPTVPARDNVTIPVFSLINTARPTNNLVSVTAWPDRNYQTDSGQSVAIYLYRIIESIINYTQVWSFVSVRYFQHKWLQPSVIVSLKGKSKPDEIVIIGAHIDTLKGRNGPMPGADDDGSGVVTILEAFNALCDFYFQPERTVEFHFYSAEEQGLLGSQDVAQSYQKENKDVVAMIQFDMTGYSKKKEMAIIKDFSDEKLSELIFNCATKYLSLKVTHDTCGYGCSDHASWNKAGYRSAMPHEAKIKDTSPYIHTSQDKFTTIDFSVLTEFVKLAVSLVVELSF